MPCNLTILPHRGLRKLRDLAANAFGICMAARRRQTRLMASCRHTRTESIWGQISPWIVRERWPRAVIKIEQILAGCAFCRQVSNPTNGQNTFSEHT